MYGDTLVMRRRAAQLREQGEDIRTMAEQLVTRGEEVVWTGRAADAMRDRVRERAAHLRDAANAHDDAAASLEKHLTECERLTESIAGVERRASSLVADARTRLARLQSSPDDDAVRPTATREDHTLVAFVPPPSGHKDWLDVELPGL
jgi:chromosome segregation ATPase